MGVLLEGHLAAVTGGGSGIGEAIALGYAKQGARVIVIDINGEAAARTVKAIEAAGGTAWSFKLDVADGAACRRLATEIANQIGRISVLVNNAGITAAMPSPPMPRR